MKITSKFASFNANESEPGVCPLCGGNITSGCTDSYDTFISVDFECDNCGCTGQEFFNLVFDGYDVEVPVITKHDIYNQLSNILTRYENPETPGEKPTEQDLYHMLCEIQSRWEDTITEEGA